MKIFDTVCVLIGTSVVHALLNTIEISDNSAVNDAVIGIMKSCLSKKIRTVGLIAASDNFLLKMVLSSDFDITLIGDNMTNSLKKSETSHTIPYKLHNFIINAHSVSDLSHSLGILRSSVWWNFAGHFVIMEKYPSDNYCKNANGFLRILWKYNILDGIFICTNVTQEVTVFGFNPYNEQAPAPWTLNHVINYEEFYEHSFTIFKRLYITKCPCNNIFFEKISNLNGYSITSSIKNHPPAIEINIDRSSDLVIRNKYYPISKTSYYVKLTSKDWDKFRGMDIIMAQEFLNFYNATTIIKIYDNDELFGAVDQNGNFYGMLKDQKTGDIDISFNNRFMLHKGDIPLTYPLQQSELSIVSHYRGSMNILMRIIAFLNLKILISMWVVSLFTIFVFIFLIGEELQVAILQTLQLLLGMAIHRIIFNLSSRIIFSCLMLYYFIISSSVQSNMYAIVTARQSLQNIDSFADLENLEYKLYVGSVVAAAFKPRFYKNLEVIKNDHCIDNMLDNSYAACIDDIHYLKYQAARHDLHVMKEGILKYYLVYPMRADWPLSHKLNYFNKKLNEAGILKMLILRSIQPANDVISYRELNYKSKKFKVLTLHKCRSIFYFWLGCIFISTAVFIIEVQIFRCCRKNSNNFIIIWWRKVCQNWK
ncbi:hypothetical protein PV327_004131 [Microctonus hyperodae]|uniref:Uncharacterized protein n=1 Tax=Microctonus hyperodae TaxID=165561 RepID=A0AA39FC24_MICHY|nr:hypothetical protein PV327_004131 [Microctonus hyperodae]